MKQRRETIKKQALLYFHHSKGRKKFTQTLPNLERDGINGDVLVKNLTSFIKISTDSGDLPWVSVVRCSGQSISSKLYCY